MSRVLTEFIVQPTAKYREFTHRLKQSLSQNEIYGVFQKDNPYAGEQKPRPLEHTGTLLLLSSHFAVSELRDFQGHSLFLTSTPCLHLCLLCLDDGADTLTAVTELCVLQSSLVFFSPQSCFTSVTQP